MKTLSVIVPNFNYGDYIASAIDSALAVDWPDVEVIVVDDGSTDDSRERISAYGDRITAIFQENAGPRMACNAGFQASSGDAVVFLDSDDVLEPTVAREVSRVWSDRVSKVQFPMAHIDKNGNPTGKISPAFGSAPSPDQVRHWMRATGEYPTPPGSGNVYARRFLEQLFPVGDRCGNSTDSTCLAAAPYLGDVVTITTPQARYRQHGDNRSHLLVDRSRFTTQQLRAVQRHELALELSGNQQDGLEPLFRGRHLLQLRVAGRRLNPDSRPLPGDSRWRMARSAFAAPFAPGPDGAIHRTLVSAWSLATLVAPKPVAERLIEHRFRQSVAG